MDRATMISALIGLGLPYVVALVNRAHWPTWGKSLTAIGLSAVVGSLTAWASGDLSGLSIPAAIVACYAASQVAYGTVLKASATAIEAATTKPVA